MCLAIPRAARPRYSCDAWRSTAPRRSAAPLAGAVAAGVWAAQQPLDKRRVRRRLRRRRAARQGGRRAGAGAGRRSGLGAAPRQRRRVRRRVRATSRRALPLPAVGARARGRRWPSTSSTWPLAVVCRTACTRRRDDMPRAVAATARALAQATWRHLLFGVVLGELERRLNATDEDAAPGVRARRLLQRPRLVREAAVGAAGEA